MFRNDEGFRMYDPHAYATPSAAVTPQAPARTIVAWVDGVEYGYRREVPVHRRTKQMERAVSAMAARFCPDA